MIESCSLQSTRTPQKWFDVVEEWGSWKWSQFDVWALTERRLGYSEGQAEKQGWDHHLPPDTGTGRQILHLISQNVTQKLSEIVRYMKIERGIFTESPTWNAHFELTSREWMAGLTRPGMPRANHHHPALTHSLIIKSQPFIHENRGHSWF